MNRLDLRPLGGVLHSIANQKMNWAEACGEYIDNSLDAGARTIGIDMGKKAVIVTDDGRGCQDPSHMVRLGDHLKTSTTRLGRYGIGGKDAALWIGGVDSTVLIRTVHAATMRTLAIHWLELERNQWWTDPPVVEPASAVDNGTIIRISPVARTIHTGEKWKHLVSELGYVFFPALKRGSQIKFRRDGGRWEPLVRWEPPAFQGDVVREQIVVNGHSAVVTAGVVKSGEPNRRPGFTYSHEWRVVQENSGNGCGNHSLSHICGVVELDRTWPLNKNKNGISRGADELYAAVEQVAKDVLRRGDSVASELHSTSLESDATARFNEAISADRARAKRHKGAQSGTRVPTGAGGPHRRAAIEQDGDRFRRRGAGGYRIEFVSMGGDVIGEFKAPVSILLNSDNAYVRENVRARNTAAIVSVATALVSYQHCDYPPEAPLLKGKPQMFGQVLGEILAAVDLELDGSRVLDAPDLKVVAS